MPNRVPLFRALVLGLILVIASSATPGTRAQSTPQQCESGCLTYLPTVSRWYEPPKLVRPIDAIDAVSPTLEWTVVFSTTYQVQVSTSPEFKSNVVNTTSAHDDVGSIAQLVITFNLSDRTRYYWRVGARVPNQPGYLYSPVSSFVTGRKSSFPEISAPNLVGPETGSVLSTQAITATWQVVPGATVYRIKVVDGTDIDRSPTVFSAVVSGATSTQTITGLAPGKTYTWSVRARNEYAWGDFAPPRTFTTTP